ncbi:MAG: hypothetical protein HZB51_28075 [Chloroflexi bacterium]|nr:hypothetical protein [Chloroflexota bacterium]
MSKYALSPKEIVNDIVILLLFPAVFFLVISIPFTLFWFWAVFDLGLGEALVRLGN